MKFRSLNRRRLFVVGTLACLGLSLAAFALWPRGSVLEWCTSPPLQLEDRVLRVRMLVPQGWRTYVEPKVGKGNDGAYGTIQIGPEAPNVFVRRLRRLITGQESPSEGIWISMNYEYGTSGMETPIKLDKPGVRPTGERKIGFSGSAPRVYFSGEYARGDQSDFEATYRSVCESIRVISDR